MDLFERTIFLANNDQGINTYVQLDTPGGGICYSTGPEHEKSGSTFSNQHILFQAGATKLFHDLFIFWYRI